MLSTTTGPNEPADEWVWECPVLAESDPDPDPCAPTRIHGYRALNSSGSTLLSQRVHGRSVGPVVCFKQRTDPEHHTPSSFGSATGAKPMHAIGNHFFLVARTRRSKLTTATFVTATNKATALHHIMSILTEAPFEFID